MMILALVVTLILAIIAALHMAWGLQIWVPIRDEAQLARAVVGGRGISRMPGAIPCFLVVVGLCILALSVWFPAISLAHLVLWAGAIVFVGRGVLAFAAPWRRLTPEEPFATLDRRYYGPLCLAIGSAFIILNLGR